MSNSRLQNFGKSGETNTQTIGFRFHANDEELEEVQSELDNSGDKNTDTSLELKIKTALLTSDSLESGKSDDERNEAIGDVVKDPRNLLSRRSTSVDSTYESPFSNPIETWRKLSELKEKITKTVEEKISEMKIDRNVLSKSSRARLLNSKENSSISDSEDTSESSKLSEQWKDAEDLSLSSNKGLHENCDSLSKILETTVENVKMELESRETCGSDLRNRKIPTKISEIIKVPDIKIATAKSELVDGPEEGSQMGEVESGVEADENLDPTETESVDLFDDSTLQTPGGGSQTPPSGGNDVSLSFFSYFSSLFLSQTLTFLLVFGLGIYLFLPMSDFIQGFLLCFLLIVGSRKVTSYLQIDELSSLQQRPFIIPDYKSLPPLKVPHYQPVKGVWINEYEHEFYDPDYYSVTHTVPAYLELEDSILKLSRPKGKINKRATFDEPEYKMQFVNQRVYDIRGCNIYLLPEGLTRKRLFSKKYPIVIFLKPDSLIQEKSKSKEVDEKESRENVETEESPGTPSEPIKNRSSLYLFARCDRQKEEWYRRLLAATRLPTSPVHKNNEKIMEATEENGSSDSSPTTKEPSTPFETLFFDDDAAQIEEYLRYMSKFVDIDFRHEVKSMKPRSSWYKKFKTKKKDIPGQDENLEHFKTVPVNGVYKKSKSSRTSVNTEMNDETEHEETLYPSLQVQWFNAFINRILFDVFRSPYWLSKIHDKIQKKLNSIRLPYYIEEIEVIEMDLGKTGPTFHRVSQPYIDERGLWFDMDTTFDGLIKLTIQTHLNLIKLQKGLDEENETIQSLEKPEKGKKKHKEVKDPFLIKESKEKSKELINQRKEKLPESCSNLCSVEPEPEEKLNPENSGIQPKLGCVSSENCELIDEVAQLAEIAVEEGLIEQNKRSPIYDSELEDSAESSDEDDEEEEEVHRPVPPPTESEGQTPVSTIRRYPKNRRSSKKIFRVFENVAQSKYFKSVAQTKYIQKAIAGVSATKLRLSLELKSCTGTLAVNIPPPPSDRFWYGFREMPKISLSVNPKIGEKTLRFVHIKNYLQKKILHELKKVMVIPNMIDFVLLSPSTRSSSSLQIDLPDLDDQQAISSD